MTQCCFKTHREDPRTFPKIDAVLQPNCCIGIRHKYPTNIAMLRDCLVLYPTQKSIEIHVSLSLANIINAHVYYIY